MRNSKEGNISSAGNNRRGFRKQTALLPRPDRWSKMGERAYQLMEQHERRHGDRKHTQIAVYILV
jgi:hypothetical protein